VSDAGVDRLRALRPPRARRARRRLDAELGAEAFAALATLWAWWRRPAQRFPTAAELRRFGIVVFVGEYGAGKTRTAWEFLVYLILIHRARGPRIIASTGAAAREIVEHRLTGILAWRKPGVAYRWEPSKGYEGELSINDALVALMSTEAPRAALGAGVDVQLIDDPPKFGAAGKPAFIAALKSSRERGALTIIPTTTDGVQLVADVLGVQVADLADAGVLVIDLGSTEANAGNLDPSYLRNRASMKRAGTWDPTASTSPWREVLDSPAWPSRRLDPRSRPPLVEIAVSIDPNKEGASKPCEVGIIGGGRAAANVLHLLYDKSGVLAGATADGWPKVAWDLAEQLHREHPAAPFPVFVFESNVGRHRADLLYHEERSRRGFNARCQVVFVKADADKCVRGEAPARVAGQGQVRFAEGLHVLEGQLRNLTPKGLDSDRADAANHLLTHLGKLGEGAKVMTEEQERAESEAQCALAASMMAAMATKRSPPPDTDEGRLMKVEGAPVGDVRGPARPPPRAPSWRTRGVL
jgi:phage terminase large subunit-like protein